jgi:hypothetical protein
MFRRLRHPPSALFRGKAINPKGLVAPFKARDYLLEAERIKCSLLTPQEGMLASEEAKKALPIAERMLRRSTEGDFTEVSEQEKSFFMCFYPLSILRQEILSRVSLMLQASNPELSVNRITATKNNLTGLYAVLKGGKPLSIVCSAQALDILHDARTLDFGRFGKALGIPLDRKSWLIATSTDSFDGVKPEMFYNGEEVKAGAKLGYPIIAVSAYADGNSMESTLLHMMHLDREVQPWFFDGIFVAPMLECGTMGGEDFLKKWHSALTGAIANDEALGLLVLESKIKTIIQAAQAVEAHEAKIKVLAKV